MAQGFPTQVGHDAVKGWYSEAFKVLTLDIKFDFHEVVVISDEWAFTRTSSSGTQALQGQKSPEANQEMFVMKKEDGDWKIARYSFSTTLPPN